jgi:hypothetical protein
MVWCEHYVMTGDALDAKALIAALGEDGPSLALACKRAAMAIAVGKAKELIAIAPGERSGRGVLALTESQLIFAGQKRLPPQLETVPLREISEVVRAPGGFFVTVSGKRRSTRLSDDAAEQFVTQLELRGVAPAPLLAPYRVLKRLKEPDRRLIERHVRRRCPGGSPSRSLLTRVSVPKKVPTSANMSAREHA